MCIWFMHMTAFRYIYVCIYFQMHIYIIHIYIITNISTYRLHVIHL